MTRKEVFQLRLSSEEKARLQTLAESADRTVSDFIRWRVFGADVGGGLSTGSGSKQSPSVIPAADVSAYEARVKQLMAQGNTTVVAKMIAKQEGLM